MNPDRSSHRHISSSPNKPSNKHSTQSLVRRLHNLHTPAISVYPWSKSVEKKIRYMKAILCFDWGQRIWNKWPHYREQRGHDVSFNVKRGVFNFSIVIVSFLSRNISLAPAYGVYVYQFASRKILRNGHYQSQNLPKTPCEKDNKKLDTTKDTISGSHANSHLPGRRSPGQLQPYKQYIDPTKTMTPTEQTYECINPGPVSNINKTLL